MVLDDPLMGWTKLACTQIYILFSCESCQLSLFVIMVFVVIYLFCGNLSCSLLLLLLVEVVKKKKFFFLSRPFRRSCGFQVIVRNVRPQASAVDFFQALGLVVVLVSCCVFCC